MSIEGTPQQKDIPSEIPQVNTNTWEDVARGVYQATPTSSDTQHLEQASPKDQPPQSPPEIVENVNRFAKVATEVLHKIDNGDTGYVTKEQLAKAVEDPSFKGEQAQVLAAMYANFKELHNFAGSHGMFDRDSISIADINDLKQRSNAQANELDTLDHLVNWAEKNGDTEFSQAAIANLLKGSDVSEQDRPALNYLNDHFKDMAKTSYRVSAKDILNYSINKYEQVDDTVESMLRSSVRSYVDLVHDSQASTVSHDLYGSNDSLSNIKPEAIRQGLIGDCYFEGALASVAVSNPNVVKDAIKDNHNGTYTVTFPGDKDNPITISAPTDAELGLYNHASKYGTWASVMEKAYGELLSKQDSEILATATTSEFPPPIFPDTQITPQDETEHGGIGGFMDQAIQTLTGKAAQWVTVDGQENTRNKLESALSGNPPKAVTACCSNDGQYYSPDGYVENHAYSILGFNPNAGNGGEVTVYNPWGKKDVISLEKFVKNFGKLVIEN